MERAICNGTPKSQLSVSVSPDQLRQIADRLEHMSKDSLPGEQITYEFSRSVALVFDPEVSTERYFKLSPVNSSVAAVEYAYGEVY